MRKQPESLFRYRALPSEEILKRELDAIRSGYLFAPPFADMNDPMEAFYETGGRGDAIFNGIFSGSGRSADDIYEIVRNCTAKFGLVSFSTSALNLLLWGYYAGGFSGFCLEFDSRLLRIGDFQNEPLRPVEYVENVLQPISFDAIASGVESEIIERLSRKRVEWQHEDEWRFLTGTVGARYYVHDALRRIYLGPKISDEFEAQIIKAVDGSGIEVLKGGVEGYLFTFMPVYLGAPNKLHGHVSDQNIKELYEVGNGFLKIGFGEFRDKCLEIAGSKSFEEFSYSGVAQEGCYYIWVNYRLGSGRIHWQRLNFDSDMMPFSSG